MASDARFTITQVGISAIVAFLLGGIALALFQYLKQSPETSSPIKVRGGAMTFRAYSYYSDNNGNDCVLLTTSTGSLNFIDDPLAVVPNVTTVSLQGVDHIDFFGRQPNGKDKSANGVSLKFTPTCKGPNGNQIGASLIALSGNSDFYPFRNGHVPDDDGTYIKRFWDKKGNSGKPSNSQDGDTCEHLSEATIYYTDPTKKPTPLPHCTNGECAIEILQ